MTDLLPSSIADERFQLLDRVAAARFGAIDLTKLLVSLVDHVDASALSALGWQYGAIDEAWAIASESEKRSLLKRAVARRQRRGTRWAVKDALGALGHECAIRENTQIRYDGQARYDGTFDHNPREQFHFWTMVTGATRSRAELEPVVERWKRKATRSALYFVPSVDDADSTLMYSRSPFDEHRYFDPTFDGTFEGSGHEGYLRPPWGIAEPTFDATFE